MPVAQWVRNGHHVVDLGLHFVRFLLLGIAILEPEETRQVHLRSDVSEPEGLQVRGERALDVPPPLPA